MSTVGRTSLTDHDHVWGCIARDAHATMRSVADQVGITERAVQRIVGELVQEGYLFRTRDGRRNEHSINASQALRHPPEQDTRLPDLLDLLTAPATPAGRGRAVQQVRRSRLAVPSRSARP